MAELKKFVKDGMVAVVVSPGYGSGWSTLNTKHAEQLIFDPDLVQALLDGDRERAERIVKDKCPNCYLGGIEQAIVQWVKQGDRFFIDERDGREWLELIGPDFGYTA